MIASLTPARHFDVVIAGVSIGRFREVSAWEGLIKLENQDGASLVVTEPIGLGAAFNDLMGKPTDVRVVMASPTLNLPPCGVIQQAAHK